METGLLGKCQSVFHVNSNYQFERNSLMCNLGEGVANGANSSYTIGRVRI